MDISKFNLFGVVFNFKDKAARDKNTTQDSTLETHGTDIDGLKVPTFSEPAANTDVRTAVAGIKSKTAIGTLFTNIKAALNGLVTLGEMRNYLVNNGTVTETGKYFLDAAYGKTLLDQITALNSNFKLEGLSRFFAFRLNDDYPFTIQGKLPNSDDYYQLVMQESGGHFGKQIGDKWVNLWNIATKSDLNDCLIYKGVFSGDFNNINIAPGIYRINTSDTYTNAPKRLPQYGTFIQFFNFNIQVIIDCRSICMRRYVGNPAAWEPWYSVAATEDS